MSIIKHVTLQKIIAHDFRYDPRIYLEKHAIEIKVGTRCADVYMQRNRSIMRTPPGV